MMTKRKGRLFEKEAKRVLAANWIDGYGTVQDIQPLLEEAIRRAMVRAYKQGFDDNTGRC